jgi:hypothetical protein
VGLRAGLDRAARVEVTKLWGAPPRGALGRLGRASCLYEGHIYSERNKDAVKYFTLHLVPVLAPKYKQHILSPAKILKSVIHQLNFMSNMFI